MDKKRRRPVINTTIDAGLMRGLRDLATSKGTSKYGQFVEEGIRMVLERYGIKYQEERDVKK